MIAEDCRPEADEQTRAFLKSIALYEDDDVLVINKPMGLAVQGGSGWSSTLTACLALRERDGQGRVWCIV